MVTMERVLKRYEITCRMLLHFYHELERERALETLPMTQAIDDITLTLNAELDNFTLTHECTQTLNEVKKESRSCSRSRCR